MHPTRCVGRAVSEGPPVSVQQAWRMSHLPTHRTGSRVERARPVGNRRNVDAICDLFAVVASHRDFPLPALGAEQHQLAGRLAMNDQRMRIIDDANRRLGILSAHGR